MINNPYDLPERCVQDIVHLNIITQKYLFIRLQVAQALIKARDHDVASNI